MDLLSWSEMNENPILTYTTHFQSWGQAKLVEEISKMYIIYTSPTTFMNLQMREVFYIRRRD